MAQPVTTLAGRRLRAMILTALVALALAVLLTAYSFALRSSAYLSGWVLLVMMLILAGYNLRKKLTYPPLARSSTWLQFHVYIGLLSIMVFLFHTGMRIPNGPLETTLATLYVLLAGTGLVGLFLSRAIPSRLALRGPEVLFERIPVFRRQLRERAEQLVVESAEETRTTTLADFYTRRLADFLAGPRNTFRHLRQSNRPLQQLNRELRSLDRYLSEKERLIAGELSELIEAKDTLDYHHAMQSVLKGWLFVHIPLTYALLIFAVVHAVLAYAFSGEIR